MNNINEDLDSKRDTLRLNLDKVENYLKTNRIKYAFNITQGLVDLANEIYKQTLSEEDKNLLCTSYILHAKTNEKMYEKESNSEYIITSKVYYLYALTNRLEDKDLTLLRKRDIVKLTLDVARCNEIKTDKKIIKQVKNGVNFSKKYYKATKNIQDLEDYALLLNYYAGSLVNANRKNQAVKIYLKAIKQYEYLYHKVHTKEIEDYLEKLYQKVIPVLDMVKRKTTKVKIQNKLYDITNYR